MRDVSSLVLPNGKVKRNYSIRPMTRAIISKHAHVHYNNNDSMALDYIIQEWDEWRAAKEQGRLKVVNA